MCVQIFVNLIICLQNFDPAQRHPCTNHAYTYFDEILCVQTVMNLVYAAVCCFVVTILILPHPVLALLTMVVVALILVGVLGSMALILNIRCV